MSKPRRPTSLRNVLFYGGTLVSALSVGVFAAVMVMFTHSQVHRQTDDLLLQLAAVEAEDLKTSEKATLKDIAVVLTAGQDQVARRYALILDERCQLLLASVGMANSTLKPEWCSGLSTLGEYRQLGEITNPTGETGQPSEIRAILYVAETSQKERRILFIGIDDELVDFATWQAIRTAPPLAVLVIIIIGVALGFLGNRLNQALSRLNNACQRVGVGQALPAPNEAAAIFEVPQNAPSEIQNLSQTLQGLVRRLAGLLETQERFLAEAAHELRTPLTALQGELELALRRERSAEDYKKALADAFTDAKRLSALSEGLLDAARARTVAIEARPTSLKKLAEESLRRFQRQLETANIAVSIEAQEGDPFLAQAHELSTSRVLDNLLRNALLHAKPTKIVIRIQHQNESEGGIELCVEDNGPGIPAELREHLFTPFQRASQAKGHGLGLYLAKLLMQRQGGDLLCPESITGATFCLRFRASEPHREMKKN